MVTSSSVGGDANDRTPEISNRKDLFLQPGVRFSPKTNDACAILINDLGILNLLKGLNAPIVENLPKDRGVNPLLRLTHHPTTDPNCPVEKIQVSLWFPQDQKCRIGDYYSWHRRRDSWYRFRSHVERHECNRAC